MRKDLKKTESEKLLEKRFCSDILFSGGLAVKNAMTGMKGIPDRTVYMPNGKIFLVEFKTTGKRLTTMQDLTIAKFRKRGFKVFIVDSTASLDSAVKEILKDCLHGI